MLTAFIFFVSAVVIFVIYGLLFISPNTAMSELLRRERELDSDESWLNLYNNIEIRVLDQEVRYMIQARISNWSPWNDIFEERTEQRAQVRAHQMMARLKRLRGYDKGNIVAHIGLNGNINQSKDSSEEPHDKEAN
jgi:hypothetical protein